MTDWLLVGAGIILTFGTAVFVAAEFSLVALDPSHVDDSPKNRRVNRALKKLSTHLSSAQVGITLTTILLGYTMQPALSRILSVPLADTSLGKGMVAGLAGALALILANLFSMIFGELVPKNAALANPIGTARIAAPLQSAFTTALRPIIVGLNATANRILRAMGIEPKEELSGARSAQELAALVRHSVEAGTLSPSTALLLKNTIDLEELSAVDVMTDRTRMVTLSVTSTAADVVNLARATGHSRFPVIGDGPDDVRGIVHLRKVIAVPAHERATALVSSLMVDAPRVPETIQIQPLLLELRDVGVQCAIVEDEYGGTSGIVTLEDVVEELVGEVADEHDRRRPAAYRIAGGQWVIPGLLRPDEVKEVTGIDLPSGPGYETVGGLIMSTLGRVAEEGDVVTFDNVEITVEQMDGRRIDRLRVAVVEDDAIVDGEEER